MENLFNSRLGRKFLTTIYALTALFILVFFGKIPADSFQFLVMIVFSGYIGGNLGASFIKKGNDK